MMKEEFTAIDMATAAADGFRDGQRAANGHSAQSIGMVGALVTALDGLLSITQDSTGVAGYHLNGNVAEWDEFPEVVTARDVLSLCRAPLTAQPQARADKDVHTEHCCKAHGCKYNDPACTVAYGDKAQSFPCEDCSEDAQPQASADDSRKLSDLGNELHNLSCHVVHVNEGWAEQIGKIARELWNWPQASAAQSAPATGIYSGDPLACSGCAKGCFRCMSKPQSAPAGEREALERELLSVLDFSESNLQRVVDHLLGAGYSRAAWQRTQSAANDSHDFKNFHRLLCERFGYTHDEKDWRRDQLSLIEWVAKQSARVPEGFRVMKPTSAVVRDGERWEIYAPCGSGGIVHEDEVTHLVVRELLDALAAATAQPAAQEAKP